jgi:beta-galactosidase/evolved beta-galactosidase subunit alpha
VAFAEEPEAARVTVWARIAAPGSARAFEATYDYVIGGSGDVLVDVDVLPEGEPFSPLPRVGLELLLPQSMGSVRWYGRGPGEAYVDSREAGRVGVWRRSVEELATPYVHPQENGNRTDVRWVCLTDVHGIGLFVRAYPTMDFSAHRWSREDLERAAHPRDLRPAPAMTLNLDYRQNGLGSAACGPGPWEQYLLRAEPVRFRLRLAPIALERSSPWLLYRSESAEPGIQRP